MMRIAWVVLSLYNAQIGLALVGTCFLPATGSPAVALLYSLKNRKNFQTPIIDPSDITSIAAPLSW